MRYGQVSGIDKPISRLVQGTVMVTKDLDKSFELLDGVYELGCTAFDTAHVYGSGDSERTVGRWLSDRGLRDKLVIIGKGAHPKGDRARVTPFDISADLHDTLARLRTDYIDLYLLHRDDERVPVGPLVEALNEHLEAGKIRAFGGSNWTHTRIQEANDYARAHGLVPFAASSPNFSLAEQVEVPWEGCISISGPRGEAVRAWYRKENMPLFAWSSLAGGFFSGRFRRGNLETFEGYLDKLCVKSYCHEVNFRRLDRARELAGAKGVTVPQIALAYVMSQALNLFALVGCHSAQEFKSNLEAYELGLTPEEMAWLELASDTPPASIASR